MNPIEQCCRVCGGATVDAGVKQGKFRQEPFLLRRCPACGLTAVVNPWCDFEQIYSQEYYEGRGVDPLVDYVFELESPELTVRQYEWRGIVEVLKAVVGLTGKTRWLDFGCGNGGLVRYAKAHGVPDTVGFEEGWICGQGRAAGIPILTREELLERRGSFDVITAIEVLEHVMDPVAELRLLKTLLKPGGLLFLTTGNAAPHRERITDWGYVVPEIHVNFFEPQTLSFAMEAVGLRPENRGFVPGFEDIIRFKILKNLRVRRTAWWEAALPWGLLSRMADKKHQVTAHPMGWA